VTYHLGRNPLFVLAPAAGEVCENASEIWGGTFAPLMRADGSPGVRGSWDVALLDDSLHIVEELVAHGHDHPGGYVEVSVEVTNQGIRPAHVGIRMVLPVRITARVSFLDPAGMLDDSKYYIGLRPPDPPAVPFLDTELELVRPDVRMWQTQCNDPNPILHPCTHAGMQSRVRSAAPRRWFPRPRGPTCFSSPQ
jgi:hypothetical protein